MLAASGLDDRTSSHEQLIVGRDAHKSVVFGLMEPATGTGGR
jgi:hypothetical protein